MHEQTAFDYLKYCKDDFPVPKMLSKQVFCLPMSPYLNNKDFLNILDVVISFKRK
jgi:dTDP-4-amino-4,6-dideoxygalactose transaminase